MQAHMEEGKDSISVEHSYAFAILDEILSNAKLHDFINDLGLFVKKNIFNYFREYKQDLTVQSKTFQDYIFSLCKFNSLSDAPFGAVFPNYTAEEIYNCHIHQLFNKLDTILDSSYKLDSRLAVITKLKAIANICHGYVPFLSEYSKETNFDIAINIENFIQFRDLIYPTIEELDARVPHTHGLFNKKLCPLTYGIGKNQAGASPDLKLTDAQSASSGKSVYAAVGIDAFFDSLLYDVAMLTKDAKQDSDNPIIKKLNYYKFFNDGVNWHKPSGKKLWAHKLAEPFPQVASVSGSTARLLIALAAHDYFSLDGEKFDQNKAQILANIYSAKYIYCGHHSFFEVMEIYNRLIDAVALYNPENIKELKEEKLPYCRYNNHAYFDILHPILQEEVLKRIEKQNLNESDFKMSF